MLQIPVGLRHQIKFAIPALILAIAVQSAEALAQEEPANSEGQPQANWASNCSAPTRKVPLSCTLEQRVVLRETGQQLARIAVQTSGAEPRTPGILVHLPLGLSIAAGVNLSVDGSPSRQLPIQTCDGSGCYAGSSLDRELLSDLQRGSLLKLTFEDLKRKPINVDIRLDGFSAAFDGIK